MAEIERLYESVHGYDLQDFSVTIHTNAKERLEVPAFDELVRYTRLFVMTIEYPKCTGVNGFAACYYIGLSNFLKGRKETAMNPPKQIAYVQFSTCNRFPFTLQAMSSRIILISCIMY